MTSESTAITPQQTFEQNMKDRIRQDIGELMPDDVLTEMINQGVRSAFLEDRKTHDSYGRSTTKPPWIVDLLVELLDEKMREQTAQWIVDNDQLIIDSFGNRIDERLASSVVKAFDNIFRQQIYELGSRVTETIEGLRG